MSNDPSHNALGGIVGGMVGLAVAGVQLVYYTAVGAVQLANYALSSEVEPAKLYIKRDTRADGSPVIKWVSLSGNFDKEESWFWSEDTPYEDVFTIEHEAAIDPFTSNFVVTQRRIGGVRIWRKDQVDGEPEEREDLSDVEEHPMSMCHLPWSELRRFGVEQSAGIELHNDDLRLHNAGRLRYTDHNLIRAEFANGQNFFISRCQSSKGYSDDVAFALTQDFIIGRHANPPAPSVPAPTTPSAADFDPI